MPRRSSLRFFGYFVFLIVVAPAVVLIAAPASAQSTNDSQSTVDTQATSKAPSTIKDLFFQGSTRWSQAELQAASGLRPGTTITSDDLAAAIAKLSATGDFDDVQVVYYAPGESLNLILKLKDSDPSNRYPVSFANFPWWSDKELIPLIHQTVPLFDGTLPENGDQEDAVTGALQQLLLSKQVTAKVSSDLEAPANGETSGTIVFRITSPEIRFGPVTIHGASATAPTIAKAATALSGHPYSENALNNLLVSVRDAGYVNATLTEINRNPTAPSGRHVDIQVTAKLDEGELFHVSGITFSGAPAATTDPFTAAQRPDPVNLAANQTLRSSVASIAAAYRGLGYMDVRVDSVPKLDAATHQVAYAITIVPGDQYKVGTLKVEGLTPDQRKEFDSAWKLVPGVPFDTAFAQGFLRNHPELHSLAGTALRLRIDADGDTHLVAIDVTLAKPRPRTATHPKQPEPSHIPAAKPGKTKPQPSRQPKAKAKPKPKTTPTQSSPAASK